MTTEEFRLTHDYCGSVSSGTMRSCDLIPAFAGFLGMVLPKDDKRLISLHEQMKRFANEYGECVADDDPVWNDNDWFVDTLRGWMNDIAPPGCHFETHETDGSNYGFWI